MRRRAKSVAGLIAELDVRRREQVVDLGGIEPVLTATELAGDLDMTLLRDDRSELVLAEREQHRGDASMIATAGEMDRPLGEHAHLLFRKQPAQQRERIRREQLFVAER